MICINVVFSDLLTHQNLNRKRHLLRAEFFNFKIKCVSNMIRFVCCFVEYVYFLYYIILNYISLSIFGIKLFKLMPRLFTFSRLIKHSLNKGSFRLLGFNICKSVLLFCLVLCFPCAEVCVLPDYPRGH